MWGGGRIAHRSRGAHLSAGRSIAKWDRIAPNRCSFISRGSPHGLPPVLGNPPSIEHIV
jgi:hypothetical protein